MRKKLESLRAAEAAAPEPGDAKLTRLPRRPRRMTEDVNEPPHKTWRPDGTSVYDPAPTRPVLRSELQRETGWWPIDPGAARHTAPETDPAGPDQDGSVIDLDALRRKRAGDAPTTGIRRIAKPRRISPSTSEESSEQDKGRNSDPD
ncbi:hypothetical protein ACIP5Y_30760 [Nocardia sp. NPDC088792]|uniref:hypothetical protein n=1 Tax=Nocardia sp. NPDC088792 TaxID=3364332 RepID=UPI0037F4B7B5